MLDQWNCPALTELTRLCQGGFSTEDFESICQHLELCGSCQERLSNLDEEADAFSLSFRSLRTADLELAHSIMESESQTKLAVLRAFLEMQSLSTPYAASLNPPCKLGPYEILRFMGRGGMGEVYEARQIRLNRPVAIKVIRADRQENPVFRVSFLKEMRIVGALQHPNLVTAYDAWESEGCLYLALELLDGESLQTFVGRGGALSPADTLKVITGVCEGLAHLHAHQIIHRDVKPGNVMRLRDGSIKLVDFGLATAIASNLSFGQSGAGTERYMSPEQAAGTPRADHRSDIYSAGCLLHFLLRPFKESAPPPSERQLVEDLHLIADEMTRADPDARFTSIPKVIKALEESRKIHETSAKRWHISSPVGLAALLVCGGSFLLWGDRGKDAAENAALPLKQRSPTRHSSSAVTPSPTADSFVNYIGIQFRKIPPPPSEMTWPPAPEASGLTRGVDWRNMDRAQYLSVHEVTVGQYEEVMNIGAKESSGVSEINEIARTNVSFEDVMTFCDELTRHDPNGLKYHLPGMSLLTYAAYGEELNSGHLSVLQEMLAQDIYSGPLLSVQHGGRAASGIKGICTNAWEWTVSQYRKPITKQGIIDYSDFGENSGEQWQILQGGQSIVPFVHACDINFGMNDFYGSATNLHVHIEPDDVTRYLCPIRIGERASLTYRYSFPTPIRTAHVLSCFHLFSTNSFCEIRVLADPNGESPDDARWTTVFSARGNGYHKGRVDLTNAVAGAKELLVEYALHTDEEPASYTQLARTAPGLTLPSVLTFNADLEFPHPELHKTVAVPRSYRHPNLGFRVCIEPAEESPRVKSSSQNTPETP